MHATVLHRFAAAVRRFAIPTLALLLGAPGAATAQDRTWDGVVEGWRGTVTEEGVIGASLALIRDGRLEDLEVHGLADLETGRPVDEHTLYHWASITKTFTGIAILQLRDRGLVDLDDPAVMYVPELAAVHNPFGDMEEITLRHLLSHSAGFRAGTFPWASGAEWEPHEPTEWSQLVAMMPYTEILFEPGSRFSYSNPGIVFLGRVIEAVTGDVFEAYIEKNIFRPLGMETAYFDMTPWHLHPHRSNHYWVGPEGPRAGGLDFNTGITVSNGGLNASVPDLARYMAFLMGSVEPGSPAEGVLSRSSLEEMWEAVVPTGSESPGLGNSSMGLTYFLYEVNGSPIVGHTGSQRAFFTFFLLDPETRTAVLGAFNSGGVGGHPPDIYRIRLDTQAALVEAGVLGGR